jgi:hypothetical protein
MTAPILAAITILRNAVYDALDPLTTDGVYWEQAPELEPYPFVVYQSQDAGGRAERQIGDMGWSGVVTVKAIAESVPEAESLMAAVAPGMDSLAYTDYSVSSEYLQPVVIPPSNGIYQSCHQWRVYIYRTS